MENFIIQQEQSIKNLENEISSLTEDNQNKDIKYKQLDKTYLSIIKVIEEHKKTIKNLQDKINKKTNDEKASKLTLYEKEQEIVLLRNIIASHKNDVNYKNINGYNNSILKSQVRKAKENFAVNNVNAINSNYYGNNNRGSFTQRNVLPRISNSGSTPNMLIKKEESFRIENNNSNKNFITVNDPEEENLKEITNLMKKILDE